MKASELVGKTLTVNNFDGIHKDKPKHVSIERYAELFIKERWC